ncbi:MAG: carbohydrate ABC transporter permease [Arachnia sp.]
MMSTRTKRRIGASTVARVSGTYVLLAVLSVAAISPLVFMVVTSFESGAAAQALSAKWWPERPTLGNYISLFENSRIVRWFINSTIVAVSGTVLALVTSSTAGYVFARMNFPLRSVLFWSFVAALMIPTQVMLIPQYLVLARLDWLDTYQALILPGATSAFGIFLIRQYLQSIPREFEESARVDGANEGQIYLRIMLPLMLPALATLATIQYINYWNDFLYPLVVTSAGDMRTLPVGLATLQTPSGGLPEVLAGTTIALIRLFAARGE